jgi:hypothetical protein
MAPGYPMNLFPKSCFCALAIFAAGRLAMAAEEINGAAIAERLQATPAHSGLRMDGYFIWDSSVIKVGDTYHLFSSRWPKGHPFPDDYRRHSEIIRATAKNPLGPYEFQEVVLSKRGGTQWDSVMSRNPAIRKIEDTYVLFYVGSDDHNLEPGGKGLPLRRIGYATAKSVTGPWLQSDQPVFQGDSTGPAVCIEDDGSVKMVFRTASLQVKLATAPNFRGPYTVVNENVWPADRLEDFDFFKARGQYYIICEDNVGGVTGHERWGALLTSRDGVTNWAPMNRTAAYDHTIRFTDGTRLESNRRERPAVFIENGEMTVLFTAVYDGQDSWCQPVPLSPPLRIN